MSKGFGRFLLLVSAASALLPAQTGTSTLRGTVTDTTGAPVRGVTLVIADAAISGTVRLAVTDAGGRYEAPYLWPGAYRVTIEHSGYHTFTAEGIVLEAGQVRRFDPKLTEGTATETETVQVEAPAIRSESGPVGENVGYGTRWNDAPFADLHPTPLPLLTTAPAVQGVEAGLVLSGISARRQQRWASDGVPDQVSAQTGNPSFYETAEVILAGAGLEAAHPVGVNQVSRRATDELHGRVYYKRGWSDFNARSYFDRARLPYKLTEAAGEVGWALIPNWTHLYGGGMYQKIPFRESRYADVPTEKMRAGDLGQYLDPLTAPGGARVVVRDPRTGVALANNLVPANRLSSVSSNYLKNYFPSPNLGDANTFTSNYTWVHQFGPDSYIGNWPFVRWDQRAGQNHQWFLRWMQNETASVAPGSADSRLSSTQSPRYRSLVFSDVAAFSPRLTNHLRVARVRLNIRQGQSEGDLDPMHGDSVVSTLGLQGVNPSGYTVTGFPALSVSGLTPLTMVWRGGSNENLADQRGIDSAAESVTWTLRGHAIQAGIQHQRFSWRPAEVPNSVYGAFTFTGAFTGLAFGDFLYGLPATSTRANPRIDRRILQHQTGAFLADSFRATSRLTLDYGVRWDYYASPVYEDGYQANWDAASGQVVVAPGTFTAVSAYYPKSITVVTGDVVPKAKRTNLRPRVAAAFRATDRLAVRAGYAEFTESLGYGPEGRLNPTNPYALTETYTNTISGGTAALSFPKPYPASPSASQLPGQSVTAFPARTEEGVLRQYHFAVEGSAGRVGLRAAYIGFRGAGMNYALDINKPRASATPFTDARKPYPQFAQAYAVRNDGRWRYDSMVLRANARAAAVSLDTSFTWARNFTNYANTADPYNATAVWTRDGSTRRLYSVTTLAWPLPVGKGKRLMSGAGPLVNWLVSEWSLQAIATLASGQYFSPWFTGPDPANASAGLVTALPDCVGDPYSGARTRARWFNPAAFAVPAAGAGRYGSCSMNILEGYPIRLGHASLAKRFPLGELVRAVFTVQVSNLTNTAHFTLPNTNISLPNAGMFTPSSAVALSHPAGLAARRLAFALRVEW